MYGDELNEWWCLQRKAQQEEDPVRLAGLIDQMNAILSSLEKKQPQEKKPLQERPPRQVKADRRHAAHPPSLRKRAIIFDEEEFFRTVLWHFFDRRGYEVLTFPYPDLCPLHIGPVCPCPLSTVCSDIIVADLNMTGRNGIDFIEQLMAKGCKQKNFALTSGAFRDEDRARVSRIGCALFEKPLDMVALTEWVEKVEAALSAQRVLFDWLGDLSPADWSSANGSSPFNMPVQRSVGTNEE